VTDEEIDKLYAENILMAKPSPESQANLSDDDIDKLYAENILMAEPELPQERTGEAFAQSFGNSATFGYLPQIQAGTEPFIQGALDAVIGDNTDQKLAEQGFQFEPSQEPNYLQRRDSYIQRQEQLAKENPYSSIAGDVAGAVTGGIVTGGALSGGAKAASLGGRLVTGAKTGAAVSAISNPGDTEGEISALQLKDRATNALTGAALGAGAQAIGEIVAGAGKAIRKAPAKLENISTEFGFRSLGPVAKDLKAIRGRHDGKAIIKTLQDNKIIEAGDTVESILPKVKKLTDTAGQELDDVYTEISEAVSKASGNKSLTGAQFKAAQKLIPNGEKIASEARNQIAGSLKNDSAGKITESAQSALNFLKEKGRNLSIKDLREIKTNLDRDIRYPSLDKNSSDQQKQLKAVRDIIKKEIDRIGESAGEIVGNGSDLSKKLKAANAKYAHSAIARDIVEGQAERNLKNRFFSLTDKIAGAAGMAGTLATGAVDPTTLVKTGIVSLAASFASKNARKYGAPIASRAAKRLSEAMRTPAYFAKYGKPLIEAAKISPEKFNAVLASYINDPKLEKAVMDPASFDEKYRGPAKSK
jgi:hypothetical protein